MSRKLEWQTRSTKQRVICPKCNEAGLLFAEYCRRIGSSNWSGPYFRVAHVQRIYDPEKYQELINQGFNSEEAGKRALSSKNRHCYVRKSLVTTLRKVYPKIFRNEFPVQRNKIKKLIESNKTTLEEIANSKYMEPYTSKTGFIIYVPIHMRNQARKMLEEQNTYNI